MPSECFQGFSFNWIHNYWFIHYTGRFRSLYLIVLLCCRNIQQLVASVDRAYADMSVSLIRPMGNSTVLQVSYTECVCEQSWAVFYRRTYDQSKVAETLSEESMGTQWLSYQIYGINSGSVVHFLPILVNPLDTVNYIMCRWVTYTLSPSSSYFKKSNNGINLICWSLPFHFR